MQPGTPINLPTVDAYKILPNAPKISPNASKIQPNISPNISPNLQTVCAVNNAQLNVA